MHTYPEIWKKYCDDIRLRFCVGIDLCHILVGKNQKNKYFPSPLLRYHNFKIWRPLKQTKSKNGCHFIISTFENLQLCFFVQKDSSSLKVLKMQFVFGSSMIRNIADWICNVPYRRPKTNCIFRTFRVAESFWTKKQSCKFSKVDIMFFDFVCFNGRHILKEIAISQYWRREIFVFLVFPNQYMAKINSHTKS